MNFKKIAALTLAVSLLGLTACGSKNDAEDTVEATAYVTEIASQPEILPEPMDETPMVTIPQMTGTAAETEATAEATEKAPKPTEAPKETEAPETQPETTESTEAPETVPEETQAPETEPVPSQPIIEGNVAIELPVIPIP